MEREGQGPRMAPGAGTDLHICDVQLSSASICVCKESGRKKRRGHREGLRAG